MGTKLPDDDCNLACDGRVLEVLSEHLCQGWIEGYLLTGRHGFFSSYEAFIPIITSMFSQHAKWLKVISPLIGHIPWRRQIASLNYFLTSHVWRQGTLESSPPLPCVLCPSDSDSDSDLQPSFLPRPQRLLPPGPWLH